MALQAHLPKEGSGQTARVQEVSMANSNPFTIQDLLRSKFQIINSTWQISFTPSFSKSASPAICPSHALYKFPLGGKEMKKHKSII